MRKASGDTAVYKALCGAMVDTVEAHAADDIRLTFRLYDEAGPVVL